MSNSNGAITSSSSSSSSCLTQGKSMEDVWKDISLNALNQDIPSTSTTLLNNGKHESSLAFNRNTTSTSLEGIILEDFLAGPYKSSSNLSPSSNNNHTVLAFCPGQVFTCMKFIGTNIPNTAQGSYAVPVLSAKKRALEDQLCDSLISNGDGVANDSRKRKMIKNRESAARSRARKQAYTSELEQEVAKLLNENLKLKRQLNELRRAVELSRAMDAQATVVTKATLQRTLTAPF